MAETIVQTITQQTTPSTHLVRDVSTVLSKLQPDRYPLDTMLRRMPSGPRATQDKIEWAKISSLPRKDTLNGATEAGNPAKSKDIVVTNGLMWRVDDVFITPLTSTNPAFWVKAINGNTLTVYALGELTTLNPTGFGTVPALADQTVISWLGNAKAEGFDASVSRMKMPDYDYNWQELFDATVTVSKTRRNTKNYTEDDYIRSCRSQLEEFRKSIEGKIWFQKASRTVDPTTGEHRWTMNGITRYITKQLKYDKDLVEQPRITEAMVIDWLVEAFSGNNGSENRFLFADTYLSGELLKVPLVANRLRDQAETVLGVKVNRLEVNMGTVFLKTHRMFNELGYDHFGVIVDMENIQKRDLRPMERIILKLEDVGKDLEGQQYKEQSSIAVVNPPTHALIIGE
jgi:hypothetical protein